MNDTYITLNGWVGSDVSLREVGGGQPVANFRVATTSRKPSPLTSTRARFEGASPVVNVSGMLNE